MLRAIESEQRRWQQWTPLRQPLQMHLLFVGKQVVGDAEGAGEVVCGRVSEKQHQHQRRRAARASVAITMTSATGIA